MNWDGYTVFSAISGSCMLALGVAGRSLGRRDRLWMVAAGLFYVGYGFFVAVQVSGTFVFPIIIFVVPFIAIGYFAVAYYNARRKPRVGTRKEMSQNGTGPHAQVPRSSSAPSGSEADKEIVLPEDNQDS